MPFREQASYTYEFHAKRVTGTDMDSKNALHSKNPQLKHCFEGKNESTFLLGTSNMFIAAQFISIMDFVLSISLCGGSKKKIENEVPPSAFLGKSEK